MSPGLDLYDVDPAQPLATPGEELHGLDDDDNGLYHLSVEV